MKLKVHILDRCPHCLGKAYLSVGEAEDYKGEMYTKHKACPYCEGSGRQSRWVELPEFLLLLEQEKCLHERISSQGGFHLVAGEIYDDIKEVCADCGAELI